jgi:hypothetical protein
MPLKLWKPPHIPDSEGIEGREMEGDLTSYFKPEIVVPTSDIYEREVYFLL